MKSAAAAMVFAATTVAANGPIDYASAYGTYTAEYTSDNCVIKANGGEWTVPSDKCTPTDAQTEPVATILSPGVTTSDAWPAGSSDAWPTASSDAWTAGSSDAWPASSGEDAYTDAGSTWAAAETYFPTDAPSWTTAYPPGTDNGAWPTSGAAISSDCTTTTTPDTPAAPVAPVPSSAADAWGPSSPYGWATVSSDSLPQGPSASASASAGGGGGAYNSTWTYTTEAAPTETGATSPQTDVPTAGAGAVTTTMGLLAAVSMLVLVAL